jgi:hypothetical protein
MERNVDILLGLTFADVQPSIYIGTGDSQDQVEGQRILNWHENY